MGQWTTTSLEREYFDGRVFEKYAVNEVFCGWQKNVVS